MSSRQALTTRPAACCALFTAPRILLLCAAWSCSLPTFLLLILPTSPTHAFVLVAPARPSFFVSYYSSSVSKQHQSRLLLNRRHNRQHCSLVVHQSSTTALLEKSIVNDTDENSSSSSIDASSSAAPLTTEVDAPDITATSSTTKNMKDDETSPSSVKPSAVAAVKTSSSSSTRPSSSSSSSLYHHLDRMSRLVDTDHWSHAIGRASAVETAWRNATTTDSSSLSATDSYCLNAVLKAWSRCCAILAEHKSDDYYTAGSNSNNSSKMMKKDKLSAHDGIAIYTPHGAAEHAQELLFQQLQQRTTSGHAAVDATSFNIVMDAWAKSRSKDATQKIQALMDQMLVITTTQQGVVALPASSGENTEAASPLMRLDDYSYHALIESLTFSQRSDRIKAIHLTLDKMKKSGIRPSIRTWNLVLSAYKRSPTMSPEDAARDSMKLFRYIQSQGDDSSNDDEGPNVNTYTSVMDALAECMTVPATMRAQELFDDLKQRAAASNNGTNVLERYQPNVYTYTTLIKAYSKIAKQYDKAPQQADALLNEALLQSESVVPNSRLFTVAIQCWTHSNQNPKKAVRALEILKQMRELAGNGAEACRPNFWTYKAALDACSHTAGVEVTAQQQATAIKIAMAIFKAMQQDKSVSLNHVIFASLLRSTYLLPVGSPERSQVAQAVFKKAIDAGQVDSGLVKLLRSVDATAYNHIVALHSGSESSVKGGDGLQQRQYQPHRPGSSSSLSSSFQQPTPELDLPAAWGRNVKT